MRQIRIILVVAAVSVLVGIVPARADQQYRGRVIIMKGSRLQVKLEEDNGKRTFDVTSETRFFTRSGPAPVKRLRAGSKVRIVERNGDAYAVFIEEVPQ
jgi:hypothetical protein